ncbi:MAG: tetratricopeptide repeat protein [Deltaproteobacteria bacterium]|jgi:tetratricopeptide (TPR) repeat protein|nr:tetratricopeptide repeat protein [Deltaproteobacteria bacterium]MBT4268059.1 tetratricopeptide repeat protein [Deltaproteobacteria bacterium]MBT4641473.1 tetratricopeptide repeat protein [Deltaproteobacteria bacterium]MBT6500088.1 tetratricopeptide repeat protein [Deltaproteobacteria bacterium]MBT6614056.1 tetratricopeptide repeat protein [Deltaproteobacteria bacterium]
MPFRKIRFPGSSLKFLAAVLIGLLLSAPVSFSNEIKETTSVEVEDRDLIHHLLKDEYYIFAQEEAVEYLNRYPNGIFRAEIIFVQAKIDVIQKSYAAALKKYDHLLKRFSDSELFEDSLYLSGILHLKLKQNNKGQDKLQRLIKKYPRSRFLFRTYFHLGELAFKQKNWKTAEVYLKRTVKNGDLKPGQQLEAKNNLAWTYYFQKKYDLANELFQPLLESDLATGHKAKICFQYASDAQKIGDYRAAIKWHEQLMDRWPHPEFINKSRFWIAESLFLLNQTPDTKISAADKQKAILLFGQNLNLKKPIELENTHYHRGWFLLELGKSSRAEADFKWLQKNNAKYGKDIDLTLIRAHYFESLKKWTEANQIYAQSLKLQEHSESRNQLLNRIIKNNYRQKRCKKLINNYKAVDFSVEMTDPDEMHYYAATCLYNAKEWVKAGHVYSKIDPLSRFAPLSFEFYLAVFRKTGQLENAIAYLIQVQDLPHFKDKKRIFLIKTNLYLELKQWHKALSNMKAVVNLSPETKKDPWFLLNVAKTIDQITIAMKNITWREQRPELRPAEYYQQQALIYYQKSYKVMPEKETATRLSILEILLERYEHQKKLKKLIPLYRTAINISTDEHQKNRYIYRLANILIETGEKKDPIISLLTSLHGKANREINYKASALMAELYIAEKNYKEAIETLIDLGQQPIDKTPWYIKVHFRLGELYQSQEKWLTSIRHYSKVVNSKQKGSQEKEARSRLFKIKKFVKQQQSQRKSK